MSRILVMFLLIIGGTAGAVEDPRSGEAPSWSPEKSSQTGTVREAVYRIDGKRLNPVISAPSSMRISAPGVELRSGKSTNQLLQAETRLSTLRFLIMSTGITWPRETPGGVTLLLPTDEALNRLPQSVLSDLANDPETLERFLRSHAIPGVLHRQGLESRVGVLSLARTPLEIAVGGGLRINDSVLVIESLETRDGVVHLVDGVLPD